MTRMPSRRLLYAVGIVTIGSLALLAFPDAWLLVLTADLVVGLAALIDLGLTPGPSLLAAERLAPERMSSLQTQAIGVRVTNRSRSNLRVRVCDAPPVELQVVDGKATTAMAHRGDGVSAAPALPMLSGIVPANGERHWDYEAKPLARGRYTWGPLALRYQSLLGLWEIGRTFDEPSEVRVYPNLVELQRYHLLAAANRLEAAGIRKVRPRGTALEFESLRDYATGDDVRQIDWRASARRGRLIVRQQQAERNQTVLLLLDCGRLMNAREGGVSKLDHAVNAALLLAHVALARGDRVGLATFSHKVHAWLTPRGHTSQNRMIAEALYDLHGDYTESDHGRCLQLVSARHPKRALLVVLTDFVDATTASDMVAHLRHAGRRHLLLFTALKDAFLERAAAAAPTTVADGFRTTSAIELLRERAEVLEQVRRLGAFVIDAPPDAVAPPLLNQFVEIVSRGLV
ncbi:MAG: DUF58 domain-containing protein [Gemmataceae bacterium]